MAPRKGLAKPRQKCPFTGGKILYVETNAGWQVRASGWISTKFYQTKEQAEWFASHRDGVPPAYTPSWERVRVGKELEPPAGQTVEAAAAAQEKTVEQVAQSFEDLSGEVV